MATFRTSFFYIVNAYLEDGKLCVPTICEYLPEALDAAANMRNCPNVYSNVTVARYKRTSTGNFVKCKAL